MRDTSGMPARAGTVEAQTEVRRVAGVDLEFRLTGGGPGAGAVVVLPGAHMPAGCRFGEERWAGPERSVLTVSRPGYGRTAPAAGPTPAEFAGRVAELCRWLGLRRVTAAGVSMGARAALTLAAREPDLVARVLLMCPVSFLSWPETARTRRLSRVLFNPVAERVTWGLLHTMLTHVPNRALPAALAGLTTLSPAEAIRRLGTDTAAAVRFLRTCRSGRGWFGDLRPVPDVTARVRQPTLVLATPHDGSVAWRHPQHLADTLPDARLIRVPTPTHLLWLGEGSDRTVAAAREFLEG